MRARWWDAATERERVQIKLLERVAYGALEFHYMLWYVVLLVASAGNPSIEEIITVLSYFLCARSHGILLQAWSQFGESS